MFNKFFKNWKDAYRSALFVMSHPDQATKKEISVHEMMNYIAYLSLVPAILVTVVISSLFYQLSVYSSLVPLSVLGFFGIALPVVVFFVSIAYILFIVLSQAASLHFFLWLTRSDRKGLDKTFVSAAAGITPFLVFSPILIAVAWGLILNISTLFSPLLGMGAVSTEYLAAGLFIMLGVIGVVLLLFALGIWGFVVQVIGLSNQHGISRRRAFLVMLIPIIIVVVYYAVYAMMIYSTYADMLASTNSSLRDLTITQTSGIGGTLKNTQCLSGGIALKDVKYSDSKISGVVQNTGKVTLGDLLLVLLDENYNSLEKISLPFTSIDPGTVAGFDIDTRTGMPLSYAIIYTDCTGVFDSQPVTIVPS